MKIKPSTYRKIDLSLIDKTENIRQDMGNIEEFAASIESLGQLEAIGVIEKENGRFDMLYGFRRLAAFQYLVDNGKDYNQIEAKIISGDPLIIQMAENESRKNLTPEEFENGIARMIEAGLTQTEISKLLSIRITRISDTLAARNTRLKLAEKGIDTNGMSTSTVSALRNVPEAEAPAIIEKVKKAGGTVKAAKEAKKKKEPVFVAKKPEIIEKKPVEIQGHIHKIFGGIANPEKPIDGITGLPKIEAKDIYLETTNTQIDEEKQNEQGEIKQAIRVIELKENEVLKLPSVTFDEEKTDFDYSVIDDEKKDDQSFIPVILESPYRGIDFNIKNEYKKNIDYAIKCCRDCLKRGESPYAPHLQFTQFLDESTERQIGIDAGQAWYAHAAYMVVYEDYGISPGMQEGIDYFKSIKPDAKIEMRRLDA